MPPGFVFVCLGFCLGSFGHLTILEQSLYPEEHKAVIGRMKLLPDLRNWFLERGGSPWEGQKLFLKEVQGKELILAHPTVVS